MDNWFLSALSSTELEDMIIYMKGLRREVIKSIQI